ncbi:MAG: hypothetical protein RBS72_09680 [Sedimentisphaerales bacterium]|nr:hypothetical protein [Sedimentisphaerales bacterium]HNY77837.1 hypothetical protein [Sedimentisphaerales bacterium]HOC63114.1 hypothetical protein [Sedimentisphaerales bacterium]HOH64012.1 hypothetical protein [Sedimentisphaerales bacterium]HPY48262.1 hypothetical protein [Sedimentisphaerales bacterium]
MTARKTLSRLHLVGMFWFTLCVGYLLVMGLYQAGFRWRTIFSFSGHSALMIILVAGLYFFALPRGVARSGHVEQEHPLTSSNCYMGLYVSAPLLGGLAAILGMAGVRQMSRFLFGVALGTLGTTFLVWMVIDPLAGLIEMLLPASRRHRAERTGRSHAAPS